MNRILKAIDLQQQQIDERLADGRVTVARVNELWRELDVDCEEMSALQNRKNIAMLHGKLNADEAQTIYMLAGESPNTFNGQSLAVKCVLTKLLKELLDAA